MGTIYRSKRQNVQRINVKCDLPAGKWLTSWLLLVMFIVFLLLSHVVSRVRCRTWLYHFLIVASFLTYMYPSDLCARKNRFIDAVLRRTCTNTFVFFVEKLEKYFSNMLLSTARSSSDKTYTFSSWHEYKRQISNCPNVIEIGVVWQQNLRSRQQNTFQSDPPFTIPWKRALYTSTPYFMSLYWVLFRPDFE